MSCVRAKNTTHEMIVRRTIHRIGYRFRLHQKGLPGTPDVVLPRHRAVILVHGCFWHQHPRCPSAGLPASNKEFWANKLEGNPQRDARNLRALKRQAGAFWSCGNVRSAIRTGLKGDWAGSWAESPPARPFKPTAVRSRKHCAARRKTVVQIYKAAIRAIVFSNTSILW